MTNRNRFMAVLYQMSDKELAEFIEYDTDLNGNCKFCVWKDDKNCVYYGECEEGVELYLKKDINYDEEWNI